MTDPDMFLQEMARQAFQRRVLVELPFRGGSLQRFRLLPAGATGSIVRSKQRQAIVDTHWAQQQGQYFDGPLVGLTSLSSSAGSIAATYTEIRYRDYLAADQVLSDAGQLPTPLAIGVHCLIMHEDQVMVLRDSDGRALIAGGAVDMASLAGGRHPLQTAIQTEILEEAGLDIGDEEVTITRIFIGGNPTHVLCMSVLDIADENMWRAISRSEHKAEEEDIVAVETIPLTVLLPCPDTLPLMTRTALQSFISWRECGGVTT